MKKIYSFFSLFFLILLFQNCSSEFQAIDTLNSTNENSSSRTTALPPNPLEMEPPSTIVKQDQSSENLMLNQIDKNQHTEPLVLKRVTLDNVTSSSALVSWSISNLATGYIEYGLSEELNLQTVIENTFKYSSHKQPLTDLEADQVYYYRVHSEDQNGSLVSSEIKSFKTKAVKLEEMASEVVTPPSNTSANEAQTENASSSVPSEMMRLPTSIEQTVNSSSVNAQKGWPVKTDDHLPMGGVFYGNHVHGWRTANAQIGVENVRRFRAGRTGKVQAIKFNNRTLKASTVKLRCDANPSSVWCNCVKANLTGAECGYTISNSYSVGNGGTIVVQIRTDNGKGLPSETVLAQTKPFSPVKNGDNEYPRLPLIQSAFLKAGAIYHLVHKNLTPPSCPLSGLTVAQAKRCPKNEGATGLNGIGHYNSPSTTGRFGPYSGDEADANFYKTKVGGTWQQSKKVLSFYEIQYDDGEWRGDAYHAYDSSISDGWKPVAGSHIVRQIFTVERANRKVNGLWLNFGLSPSADGSPLLVSLKDSRGVVVANGKINASSMCLKMKDKYCRDWGYTNLNKNIELKKGLSYSVELSASSQAGFIVSTYVPMLGQGFNAKNMWSSSKAQYSKNKGLNWVKYANRYPNDRDMALLFTIVGHPKSL